MNSTQFIECAPEAFYKKAIQQLRDHNFKITQRRQAILRVFEAQSGYITAQAVHQSLSKEYPTMSYDTTYRNIYDFVELGILESTEFNQEQLFRPHCIQGDHHHHFICTQCGKALAIDVCPLDEVKEELGNITITSHRFDVFGLCPECNDL